MDKQIASNRQPLQNDGELLRRFQDGSDDAATEIYLRYARQLQQLARAKTDERHKTVVDSDSIVQSVFRTFFRRAENGQYTVEDSNGLWKLLLVIAINKIRSRATYLNAAKRDQRRNIPLDLCRTQMDVSDGNDAEALQILELTIEELLESLPESTHRIIVMRIEGYGVDDIAKSTGRSKRTTERILCDFKRLLQQRLEVGK